jgi:GrpB-like predicted nucleotidyltransferase (UPF0157 family)
MNTLGNKEMSEMDWVDSVLVSAGVNDAAKPTLEYKIVQSPEGLVISIWEPAPLTATRVSPFMFKVNHRVDSEEEAHRVLNDYLARIA